MNPSAKDEIKGTVHEVKGKVKETAGNRRPALWYGYRAATERGCKECQ